MDEVKIADKAWSNFNKTKSGVLTRKKIIPNDFLWSVQDAVRFAKDAAVKQERQANTQQLKEAISLLSAWLHRGNIGCSLSNETRSFLSKYETASI